MSDNLKEKGIQDRTRINTSETWEVNYWCQRLKCTPDELRMAVQKVGNSAEKVREYFNKN